MSPKRSGHVVDNFTDANAGDLGFVLIPAVSETMGSCGLLLVKTISIAMCRDTRRIVRCILVQL